MKLNDIVNGECKTCNQERKFKFIYERVDGERVYFCVHCGEDRPEEYFKEEKDERT